VDLPNLRAFAAVADTGSFSGAGERLHLTQPAVSKRIHSLESELEVQLFDRIGRRVELTEAGRALLAQVPRVEQSIEAARRAVHDLRGEISGPLRLATSHHVGLHRLPPVLSRYQQDYPQVQLDIEFLDSEQAYDLLRSGTIELAVVTLAPGDVSRLHSESLWVDRLLVMAAPGHPLQQQRRVSIDDLLAWPAVLPGLDTFTGQIVRRHFERGGRELTLRMSTNYLETLRMMAAVGLGWTVLPEGMAAPDLTPIAVAGTRLSRTLGLVRHAERSRSRAAEAFIDLLRENASGADSPG
jgi:DNA-binding transcriptional LysR family regulator